MVTEEDLFIYQRLTVSIDEWTVNIKIDILTNESSLILINLFMNNNGNSYHQLFIFVRCLNTNGNSYFGN